MVWSSRAFSSKMGREELPGSFPATRLTSSVETFTTRLVVLSSIYKQAHPQRRRRYLLEHHERIRRATYRLPSWSSSVPGRRSDAISRHLRTQSGVSQQNLSNGAVKHSIAHDSALQVPGRHATSLPQPEPTYSSASPSDAWERPADPLPSSHNDLKSPFSPLPCPPFVSLSHSIALREPKLSGNGQGKCL